MRNAVLGILVSIVVGFSDVAFAQEDYVVLKKFNSESEWGPLSRVIEASDGNLYGTLAGFAGIYKFSRDGAYTRMSEGLFAHRIIQGGDGFLYGNSGSTIYRIALTGEYTVLASLQDQGIDDPISGSLVEGNDGNLYGITGRFFEWTRSRIFKVSPSGVISIVYQFPASDDPNRDNGSSMIKGKDGYFYGTTRMGGPQSHGTIFRFHPDIGYTTLHTFTGMDGGSHPDAELVETTEGTFYGTTSQGGIAGTIFRFRPGLEFATIHALGAVDGNPTGKLTEGRDGLLYGTTYSSIFSVSPTGEYQVVHRSYGTVAADRWGISFEGVVAWYDGNLYGRATAGAGNGVLFRLNLERSSCANELDLTFRIFNDPVLYVNHTFKAESAAIVGLFVVSQFGVQPLWFSIVPPITPTIAYSLPLSPFPAIGTVGVFSFVTTSDLRTCSAWKTVETGGASVSPTALTQKIGAYLSARPGPK